MFIFDLIGAELHEFNDLECIFDVVLNENEFNYDINNAFKNFW